MRNQQTLTQKLNERITDISLSSAVERIDIHNRLMNCELISDELFYSLSMNQVNRNILFNSYLLRGEWKI